MAYGKEVIDRLCKSGTIIKASQEDLLSIIPDKTAEESADYLLNAGAEKVVVTLGSKGALFKEKGMSFEYVEPMKAYSENPKGELDFTGAGDSFGAGFMVSYVKDQNIKKAVINGNATASLVIQRSGGCTFDRMPNKTKVKKRISENVQST